MAPIFKTIVILAATVLPTVLVSAGCVANILNFNQAIIGSGCIPAGGDAIVRANGIAYDITATGSCGLGLLGQRLPSGWSLSSGGGC